VGERFWSSLPLPAEPELTGELHTDLAQLDASEPRQSIRRRLSKLEVWSSALPLVALSLLMPLTLHWAFVAVVGHESAASFAEWIQVSLLIVGHAHLALAACAIRFAWKMKAMPSEDLAKIPIHREWAKAWGFAVGMSCLPGVILLLVPPLLSAITGIVFIPFMFLHMHRRLIAERAVLAMAAPEQTAPVRVAAQDFVGKAWDGGSVEAASIEAAAVEAASIEAAPQPLGAE
jgi:hypothetical protein